MEETIKINLMANLSTLYTSSTSYQGLGRALDNGLLVSKFKSNALKLNLIN